MRKHSKKFYLVITLCFILFWCAVLLLLEKLLVPKYQSGIIEGSMIEEYYKDDTQHDVVMIGDCEVYENISTVELWKQYGITSYIRGSAQQLSWQSYYLLEDTLRKETPKVVVFNVLSLKYNEPQSEAYNRMTIDGMEWSGAKTGAIKASMTEDEKFADYLFPFLRYHSRWSELEEDDFKHILSKDNVTFNGYYMRADVRPEDEFPEPMPLTDYTLGSNAMSYLEKMKELCKDKGIRLVLVKAPTLYPHWYDQWDEQIEKYADENGLSYINFIGLRDEIGLDMSEDTYDAGLHLNVFGAEKLADYFGKWLVDNCGLADHRGESKYAEHYDKLSEKYDTEKNDQLQEIEEKGKLLSHTPAEVKETNVLKNFILLAVIAALCLTLTACGSDDSKADPVSTNDNSTVSTNEEPQSESSKPAETKDGFTLTFKGTQIALSAEMAPVVEKLGEPDKYFESESCAFQGLDKVYTYSGVVIRTYPENNVDYVLSIELKDDMTSTEEGISVGDSRQKVIEAYGESTEKTDISEVYSKGNSKLSFIFDSNDTVSSITYTASV
ncbi:MAG: hypothetical protein IJ561_08885 [Ruminococcus sp.]|nr:hypothetical protein [Ruminococcus sp.]MBR1393933.1 hypothetical protein [Ruminococcus sp.]